MAHYGPEEVLAYLPAQRDIACAYEDDPEDLPKAFAVWNLYIKELEKLYPDMFNHIHNINTALEYFNSKKLVLPDMLLNACIYDLATSNYILDNLRKGLKQERYRRKTLNVNRYRCLNRYISGEMWKPDSACSVCQEPFTKETLRALEACGHLLCNSCSHSLMKAECPVCRTRLSIDISAIDSTHDCPYS